MVVGAPTWWLSTDVPMRSFMESDEAKKALGGSHSPRSSVAGVTGNTTSRRCSARGRPSGATFTDGIHFRYQGGQVHSLLSLLSYLGSGEYRERYLGVKIPKTNIQDGQLDEARTFARDCSRASQADCRREGESARRRTGWFGGRSDGDPTSGTSSLPRTARSRHCAAMTLRPSSAQEVRVTPAMEEQLVVAFPARPPGPLPSPTPRPRPRGRRADG